MTNISSLIDIGGSSVKVIVCNSSTDEIYSYEVPNTAQVTPNHIYLDPAVLFKDILEAMNGCARKLPEGSQIENIFISSLRQGFCLIRDEQEISPIYLNSDTSGYSARKDIDNYGSKKIYEETGHWFAPQLTLPKVISKMRTSPELFEKSTKLLFVHDWLVWKLSKVILTEMTLVSAGQFANLATKNVHTDLLEYFEIDSSLLPNPEKFGAEIGRINNEVLSKLTSHWNESKVYVGGGDSHFLHMGASANKVGRVVVSAGSSTPISLLNSTAGTSKFMQPWKSTSFIESGYFLEGNLGYPGSHYGWLKKNVSKPLASLSVDMKSLSNAPTVFGACNMWNEQKWELRPAFSFLGDISQASSSDLALGITLDYAFAIASQVSAIVEDGFIVDQIVITGGGANPQIQAILNCLLTQPVEIMSSEVAIRNLFLMLSGEELDSLEFETRAEILDEEIKEYLKMQSKHHSLLYQQVEGTREVLRNVR